MQENVVCALLRLPDDGRALFRYHVDDAADLFMSADRRLAIFLTDELAKTGGADLRMTHDQMAKYMGSAREVVSRMLKYFAQEGWVRLYRGGVQVLDKKKLQALARGE